jgi:hypothetical protein
MKVVHHYTTTPVFFNGIEVSIAYGLGFSAKPSPGDTEQLVFIAAKSPNPVRLKRLLVTTPDNGLSVAYTTTKGFIIDGKRVLDLTVSCSQLTPTAMAAWIQQAVMLLPHSTAQLESFSRLCCFQVLSGSITKGYWLVPSRAQLPRSSPLHMEVTAEFA